MDDETPTELAKSALDALKPFAEYARGQSSKIPDIAVITVGSPMARRQLTLGDCRKALAFLEKMDGRRPKT